MKPGGPTTPRIVVCTKIDPRERRMLRAEPASPDHRAAGIEIPAGIAPPPGIVIEEVSAADDGAIVIRVHNATDEPHTVCLVVSFDGPP